MRILVKYFALAKASLYRILQYRIAFMVTLCSLVTQVVISYYIWRQVFEGKNYIKGLSYGEMIPYIIISQLLNSLYGFQTAVERDICQKVRTGEISIDFIRPISFFFARLWECVGKSWIQSICILLTTTMVGFLWTKTSIVCVIAYLLSAMLGFIIIFCVSITTGYISFATLNISGIYNVRKAIVDFFSGALIPLALLPGNLHQIAEILPFKGIIYTPAMILMGKYQGSMIIFSLGQQLFWLIVLTGVSKMVYHISMRKVTINGG